MGPLAIHSRAALLAIAVLGDILVLKNGNEIQGEILQEAGDRIVLKFPGGTLEIPRKQVAEVRRQPRVDYLMDEGEKFLRRGESAEAVQTYLDASKEDPTSERARKGLLAAREHQAEALEDLGRYSEARAVYEEILKGYAGHEKARKEILVIEQILEEARKEEERGKQEVAKGDLEHGIWRLERVFDRFPERRPAVAEPLSIAFVQEGDALLEKKNWIGAEEKYSRALSIDPESLPRLRRQFAYAKARQVEPRVRAGEFEEVLRLADEGLQIDPLSEPLRYYRGLGLEAAGKTREAIEEYAAIVEGGRPSGSPASVIAQLRVKVEEKLAGAGATDPSGNPRSREVLAGDYRELRTDHFVILHKNEGVAREVAFVAERSYWETFRALECSTHVRNPIRIQVFASKQEYLAASGTASWSGGAHLLGRKMGVLSEHRIYSFQDQPRLATGVLPHEIAHALFAHRLNYPDGLPIWVNEGFAVLREPEYFHRYYRRLLSQEAARKALIPLKTLVRAEAYPGDRVDLFYGQCFSLSEFLVSLEGIGTFASFARSLSGASDIDGLLRRHYGIMSIEALENRWLGWLDRGRP